MKYKLKCERTVMMKNSQTIYFYSYSGNNKELANNLGEILNLNIHEIKEHKKRTSLTFLKDLTSGKLPRIEFDDISFGDVGKVILVSPVWFGKVPKPVLKFIFHLNESKITYDLVTLRGGQADDSETIVKSIKDRSLPLPINFHNYNLADYCEEEIKDIIKVKPYKETLIEIAEGLSKKIIMEKTV